MKLSRNVLVGSLAATGMVLGLVAPSLTAQAATTSGVVKDGTVSPTTDLVKGEDAGQLGKGNLAIAYDGKDATNENDVTGHATAKSNAQVQVVSGILLLDAVPDFNFGAAAQDSTKGLVDNTKTNYEKDAIDGNGGSVQVIESRSKTPGFTLTAGLGNFKVASGDGAGDGTALADAGKGADFTLHLAASPIFLNGEALKNGNVAINTTAADIKSTGAASDAGTVMSFVGGQYETGTYSAKFDTSDLAKLTVGKTGADGTTPSVQSLHSTVTWDLNAAPVAAPTV
ncbi:WxL domain-containing protein [Companilactobacillus zhachilii]|uniref:WxL domain-containing protein n=1 Tax=Companilactobacillus zhachilii TaxID=2304606 RepID=UPI00192285C6|nr:WxL domain-containing protein [Companilactobacillus zhachilii]MBL3531347.1 WxL domain-containing protein [Companilactobacillus zhachilii]